MIIDDKGIKDSWKEYMEKLMNEEYEWDHTISADVKEGPADCIRMAEVRAVLKKMKRTSIVGAGSRNDTSHRGYWNTVDFRVMWWYCERRKHPRGLEIKCGTANLQRRPYGVWIKLLEHAMKVVERIFVHRIPQQIEIDNMQFGFVKGKGTTDAIFMARPMQENFRVKGKKLYFGFVVLEKAFDRVPREVISWAMRRWELKNG